MPLKSHFLSALEGKNALHPPVWIMRQAGRYLKEYRELRARHDFLKVCHTPELIVEATLLPLKKFELDAAILFSDILLPLAALNIPFIFEEGKGPLIDSNLDFSHLPSIDPARFKQLFAFQTAAIRALKQELKVPLIGFAGAPFTLSTYIIEGKASHHFEKTKLFAYNHPKQFEGLLDLLSDLVSITLQHQIEAGVDAVQLFDTHLNLLSPCDLERYALPYLKKALRGLSCPTILFAKGPHAPLLTEAKPTALSVDWTVDMGLLREKFPSLVLQGNLDPVVLLSHPENIVRQTKRVMDELPADPAFIFNLGHGILPTTPPEAVQLLIETVKAHYPSLL